MSSLNVTAERFHMQFQHLEIYFCLDTARPLEHSTGEKRKKRERGNGTAEGLGHAQYGICHVLELLWNIRNRMCPLLGGSHTWLRLLTQYSAIPATVSSLCCHLVWDVDAHSSIKQ